MPLLTQNSLPGGIVLGGLHGSSGKTALTCLLLAAFSRRGYAVQPFKAGPDYIDPGYHNYFSKKASITLDPWLMGETAIREEATRRTQHATGLLEGVMGLFDGSSPVSDEGSTMELARWLNWPVILCLPAAKAGRSLAATLRGFLAEAHPHPIVGVVLNGVSGASHAEYLSEALRPLGVPILGAIPKCSLLAWPERYLGLQAAGEGGVPSPEEMASFAAANLDLDAIFGMLQLHRPQVDASDEVPHRVRRRIAFAQDEAFHFYYANNTACLKDQGCELVPFSPIHSQKLPDDIDALWLGGGFPERFASAISDNTALRREVRDALRDGLPCYAECGGLMLLAETLSDANGNCFPMVGVLPGAVDMSESLQHFGYCSTLDACGQIQRGHEFHHSVWRSEPERANAWKVTRKRTGRERVEGFRTAKLHASYVHLYFPNNADFVRAQLGIFP
jgi:cobyrinic acid a,c-diamide synthase